MCFPGRLCLMATNDTPKGPVKTAHTLFSIVGALQDLDGATLTEIATELDMATSTVHNHLQTLHEMQYIVEQNGEYQIGLKFFEHGVWAKRNRSVVDVAQNSIRQLATETGEIVWLIVEEHGKGVCIDKAGGEQAVQTYGQVGKRMNIHSSAGGKSLLAFLSDERIEEIIDTYGLPAQTENTITDRDVLLEELDEIQNQGYAINNGETVDGIRAVGAPIKPVDEVAASISVAGPRYRMTDEYFSKKLPDLVLGVANEIELKLVHN